LIWNSSFKWPTVSLELVLHVSDLTPTSRAKDKLARMASYTAWLLDVLKAKWRDFLMRISLGPSSTMSAPAPLGLTNHQHKVSIGPLQGFVGDR